MYTDSLQYEEKHRRIAKRITAIIAVLLLVFMFINIFSHPDPPQPKQGVLVSFGEPNKGKGNSTPDTQQDEPTEETGEDSAPPETVEEVESSEAEESAPPPETSQDIPETDPVEESPPAEKEVVTNEDPNEAAIKKAEEEAKKKAEAEAEAKKKAEEEAKKKAEAEAEAKKKAEEEARKKAEAEAKKQAELDAKKKQYGDLFGDGKGETDVDGNQGDPDGDPDGKALEGISTGSGTVGGGLADRGLVSSPEVQDNTQKTGKVVLKVCVGPDGKVIPSTVKFTQSGSTTTDAHLIDLATRNAKKFEFSPGQLEKQCGTISFDFKVK